jgi:hypothetical protein
MGKPQPKPHPAIERLQRLRETGPFDALEPGDAEAIAEGMAEHQRGETITTDELLAYLARCDAGLEPDDD